jgi:clan AA aspartic protease
MTGRVDTAGRALLAIAIVADGVPTGASVDVWIDTGFTGELVVPTSIIRQLGLTKSGSVDAVLADGSQIELDTYSCIIRWFGGERNLELIANDGEMPLLGVGLMLGRELRIDYTNLTLSLQPAARTTP